MKKIAPTNEIHQALQFAYDFFNINLFNNQLPNCLISLQRKAKTQGYFSFRRFISDDGKYTDEIALNPEFFGVLPILDTLSTLVHEMCHLWQQHFGKPGRRGYHNKEWADKMEAIGLMPSDTHKPGGKRTGEHMGDYILENGLFIQIAQNLLKTNFSITWYDVYPPYSPSFGQAVTHTYLLNIDKNFKKPPALSLEKGMRPVYQIFPIKIIKNFEENQLHNNQSLSMINNIRILDPADTHHFFQNQSNIKIENKSNRLKYTCPNCLNSVWGKPKLNIICGDCMINFKVA